jgi:type IV pilus assembly protein PilB
MVEGRSCGVGKRIGEILVEMGRLSDGDLSQVLQEYRPGEGPRLGDYLVQRGLVTELDVIGAIGKRMGISWPFVDLRKHLPAPEALCEIPESWVRKYRIFPLFREGDSVTIATSEPWNYEVLQGLSFLCGKKVVPLAAPPGDIREAIQYHYDFGALLKGESLSRIRHEREDLGRKALAPPIIQLADGILGKGVERRASDIHVEPGADVLTVRFRVDGILMEDRRLPLRVHPALLSRFKIMADLDISERRLPQDGTVRMRIEQREIDFRLSTLPTQYGEKAAIRILEKSRKGVTLEEIGLSRDDHGRIDALVRRQRGIVLVTGPTGSGKTTTLYAVIRRIGSPRINIVTVEDPVEYQIPGINQVQVHPAIGLDFAASLRAILRQDPDVILLGEIRDRETAEIAFRAAMTGHLVLSTLHTPDAVSSVTRLIDLGIPRYVASSTLSGVIAQRLVRTLCRQCSGNRGSRGDDYCPVCRNEGYSGRIGIFEVLTFSPVLREMVASGSSEESLRRRSIEEGMTTLLADGMAKIDQGKTTREEIRRVIE